MSLLPTSFIGCLRHEWDLTPWDCIEMQLHELRPWIGWPCNGCERPVVIELPETSIVNLCAKTGNFVKLSVKSQEIVKQPRRAWPKGMSKSVARSLGLV